MFVQNNFEYLQAAAETPKVIQNRDWNYKEKYNFSNQYFGEVKIVNFRNLYQLLKASYLHMKQQGHISSGAFFYFRYYWCQDQFDVLKEHIIFQKLQLRICPTEESISIPATH